MDISVNGSSIGDGVETGATTLQDVLNVVYSKTEAARLVVIEIVMNGRVLDGADEERWARMAVDQIRTVAVTAMPFRTFLTQQGENLQATLDQLDADSVQATTLFVEGHVREATARFRLVGDGAKRAVQSIGIVNSSLLYWDRLAGHGDATSSEPVDPRVAVCAAALRAAADAIEAQDSSKFSATMRGEWAAVIASWKRDLQGRMAVAA